MRMSGSIRRAAFRCERRKSGRLVRPRGAHAPFSGRPDDSHALRRVSGWMRSSALASAAILVTVPACGDQIVDPGFTSRGHQPPRAPVLAVSVLGDAGPDDDGMDDGFDNCPSTYNADQADLDSDGIGDACEVVMGDGSYRILRPSPCSRRLTNPDPFLPGVSQGLSWIGGGDGQRTDNRGRRKSRWTGPSGVQR